MHRVTHPESVADMARRLMEGVVVLRQREAEMTDSSARGVASAASILCICLDEVDPTTKLEHGIARDIARRMIRAYLDQIERAR